jgi:hypothetical protein
MKGSAWCRVLGKELSLELLLPLLVGLGVPGQPLLLQPALREGGQLRRRLLL